MGPQMLGVDAMAREWELVTAALRLTCERKLLAGKGWKHSLTSGRCNKQKTSKRSQTFTHTHDRGRYNVEELRKGHGPHVPCSILYP